VSFDPEAVRAFEHAGWQVAAAEYDATFAPASVQFVDPLLDAAAIGGGSRVLDVCCGTGIATAAAARRGAVATGLDFSAAMLEQARRSHREIVFDQGDAEALPFADRSFTAVVSNFGVHHVPDPARAIGEALRVLRPGGRVAFTTWAKPEENIAWRLLSDAIAGHGDPNAAKTPPSGGGLDTEEAVLHLIGSAGFGDCRVETVRREWRVAEPRDLISALARGTVRTAARIAAQQAAVRPAIEAAVAAAATFYRRHGCYAVPIAAILASGARPAA
jgi:SAM-dependent methyltransferase